MVLGVPGVVGENFELSWTPHPGATAYTVVLYRSDFTELMRLDPVSQTAVVIPFDDIAGDAGGRLAWRVLALDDGDVMAASEPGYITLP